MKKIYSLALVLVALSGIRLFGQQSSFDYELSLEPVSIPGLPGLHSYTYAQYDGKWLVIGGRKDGLHARQPFNAFPASENNDRIYVVDVVNMQFWSASLNNLPTGLTEQLQTTNMNFCQVKDTLYLVGGYGYAATAADHQTFSYLTTVDVPGLVNAIQNNASISTYFKQIEDTVFAVTGGHLKYLNQQFYLVGGNRFDGRYNPMGNPTYTQAYTSQIRKFTIDNSGSQLSINNYTAVTDQVHLRRRDYNLLPQIFPNGEEGFTISSGVFQPNADLPFLYPVDITANGYTPVTSFNQYLSNYHCAVACLYDSTSRNMHALFFGGISQYYYHNGVRIEDTQVPFVNTISRLSRDANGNLYEYQMPVAMPGLQGASAEFIPNLNMPHYESKIIKLPAIAGKTLIGHIFGGIKSTALNPFSANQTNTTSADNTIYEVWLTPSPNKIKEVEIDGSNPYNIDVYPNPSVDGRFYVNFTLDKPAQVSCYVTNVYGEIILYRPDGLFQAGQNSLTMAFDNDTSKSHLTVTLVFDNEYFVTKKVVLAGQ